MNINRCDRKMPTIYKCDHCGKLVESNSVYNDREGHICPFCNMGILHRHNLKRNNIVIGNNNIFKGDVVIGKGAEIKYR